METGESGGRLVLAQRIVEAEQRREHAFVITRRHQRVEQPVLAVIPTAWPATPRLVKIRADFIDWPM